MDNLQYYTPTYSQTLTSHPHFVITRFGIGNICWLSVMCLGPPSDIWISAYTLLFWPLSGLWGHFPDSEVPTSLMSDVI